MKKGIVFFNVIIAFILVGIIAAIAASAQTVKSVKTQIAFDFRVGDKIFPAGEYLFESVSRTSDNLLRIKNVETGESQLLIAGLVNAGGRRPVQPKLVFRRSAGSGGGSNGSGEFHLAQIFLESGAWGFSAPFSSPAAAEQIKDEKNLAAGRSKATRAKAKN
jgi:stage III sporulation protein SpoIIIAA